MAARLILAIICVQFGLYAQSSYAPLTKTPYDQSNDFLESKARKQLRSVNQEDFDDAGRGRRKLRRHKNKEQEKPVKIKEGNLFEVGSIKNYKVLRDDQIIEIRNPRTGKKIFTVIKASALPSEDLNRYDLEYTTMELDKLSIAVEKHNEDGKDVTIGWDGNFKYPLIGEVYAKGKTLPEIEEIVSEKFKKYIHIPNVRVDIVKKSPLARILVIGKGFREFQGHEKILDILGSSYEPAVENIYDKVCVIRKYPDGAYKCIIVDMEYMFKNYDFSQNIPLRAGDIIRVKKIPPLFGYRFKFWWNQILSWMNEVDEMFNAAKSIHQFELDD